MFLYTYTTLDSFCCFYDLYVVALCLFGSGFLLVGEKASLDGDCIVVCVPSWQAYSGPYVVFVFVPLLACLY